jgi:hypothetical protein
MVWGLDFWLENNDFPSPGQGEAGPENREL